MSQLLQPAKQDRSRQTQDRILRATEELLRKEPFEAISVRRITQRAKTSIGSFYARFRDKKALLAVLYAAYETQLQQRLVRLRAAAASADSLDSAAESIVGHFVDTYGEIPNLSRALYEFATRSPRGSESQQLAEKRYRQYAFVLEALLVFRDEIKHPDPLRAIELGIYFMVVACRNRLHYPLAPHTRMVKLSKQELKRELTRQLVGYLRNQAQTC